MECIIFDALKKLEVQIIRIIHKLLPTEQSVEKYRETSSDGNNSIKTRRNYKYKEQYVRAELDN